MRTRGKRVFAKVVVIVRLLLLLLFSLLFSLERQFFVTTTVRH